MISNKFYYVQTAIVNSKMLVIKGSNFIHDEEFSPFFQILILLLQVPIDEIRGGT